MKIDIFVVGCSGFIFEIYLFI